MSTKTGFERARWVVPSALAGAIALLALLFGAALIGFEGCGTAACRDVRDFFHFDRETNLPSWFSVALWLGAAALAGGIAWRGDPQARLWWGVTAFCTFLSMDEGARFHERMGHLVTMIVSEDDVIGRRWQPYGAVVVLAAAALFGTFLWRLPRGTAARIVLAGAVFVAGAMGAEAVGAEFAFRHDQSEAGRILRTLQVLVEEALEMTGVVLLIHAFLHHHARMDGSDPSLPA